jgi:hypothetical protein
MEIMEVITVGEKNDYSGTIHKVVSATEKPVMYDFQTQFDDLIISSPEGDVLISWTVTHGSEWSDEECMLVKPFDNLKEFNNMKTTQIALKAAENKTLKVYLTIQRN